MYCIPVPATRRPSTSAAPFPAVPGGAVARQVRDRWHGVLKIQGPRRVGKWTAEEDAQLIKVGRKGGASAGTRVAGAGVDHGVSLTVPQLQPGL